MDGTTTNVADAAALGASTTEHRDIDGTPWAILPPGYTVSNLGHMLDAPARKSGEIQMRDADSFCRLIADQKTDTTKIYGNQQTPSFKAVFNDHGNTAGWRDHSVSYLCPLSVEWKLWLGANKRQMNQEAFAQFIEDNAPDCVSPDAATMIEISRTLEAKKKVNFASAIRLSNGESELSYEEEISGTASKGKLKVPETFSIGIAVLEGGPRYAVHARLRYRIADKGVLTLWFDLDRPHKVLEDAVEEVWASIEKTTGLPIFNGG